jgi:hypothetical protein
VPQQLLLSQEGTVVIEVVAGEAAAAVGDALIVRVGPYTARPAAREATIAIAVADPALAEALAAAIMAALGGAVDDTLDDALENAPGELRRGTGPMTGRAGTPDVSGDRSVAAVPSIDRLGTGDGPVERALETDRCGREDVSVDRALEADHPEARGAHPRTVRARSRKGLAREASRLGGAIAIVRVTARNARHLAALVAAARAAGALGVQLVWDGADPPRAAIEHHVFAALEHARATPGEPPVVLAITDQPAAALRFLIAHRAQDRRARGGTSRAERRARSASAS